VDQVRYIWQQLASAGAVVPLDPADLDVTHLVIAAVSGVDVYAVMTAARTLPLSVEGHRLQTA
jgi:hypothetical protein